VRLYVSSLDFREDTLLADGFDHRVCRVRFRDPFTYQAADITTVPESCEE
jgi:hypothetical protein